MAFGFFFWNFCKVALMAYFDLKWTAWPLDQEVWSLDFDRQILFTFKWTLPTFHLGSSGFFWVLRPISYPNPSLRCSRRWATGGIKPCCETLKWISSSLPSKNYVGILEAEADLCFDSLMIASRCESFQQMSQDYNILSTFVLKDIHCFICWWILKLKTKKKRALALPLFQDQTYFFVSFLLQITGYSLWFF